LYFLPVAVGLFKKIASQLELSDAEKTAVFSGVAASAYRLTAP